MTAEPTNYYLPYFDRSTVDTIEDTPVAEPEAPVEEAIEEK